MEAVGVVGGGGCRKGEEGKAVGRVGYLLKQKCVPITFIKLGIRRITFLMEYVNKENKTITRNLYNVTFTLFSKNVCKTMRKVNYYLGSSALPAFKNPTLFVSQSDFGKFFYII